MNKWHNEENILNRFIAEKKFKSSHQRIDILHVFLNIEEHLTLDELYRIVKKKHPEIGHATVYRTLKLFSECGLCHELHLDDGTTRYEHLYGHKHHDHLICTKCGIMIEIYDENIETLQDKIFHKYKFMPLRHHLELYGICVKCRSGKADK